VDVGEGGVHPGEYVAEAGAAGALTRQRVLLDEVLGDQFRQRVPEVVRVEDLVDEAVFDRFDGLGAHGVGAGCRGGGGHGDLTFGGRGA
jgi:hypothetical protein